ncbi:MAG: DUF973 family protein [Desulfurococcaceae archaeon]
MYRYSSYQPPSAPQPPTPPYQPPPSSQQPPINTSVFIDALGKIRGASLIFIISSILTGIGIVMFILSIISLASFSSDFSMKGFIAAVGATLLLIIFLVIGAVLALVALGKLISGARSLAQAEPEFTTASNLISIGYKWGIILLIVGALTLIILIGFLLLVLSFIFLLIGNIGLILLCFKLHDRFKDALYMVAGILFIIGIFVGGVVSFVGWILLYVALGNTIARLRSQQAYITPQPPI